MAHSPAPTTPPAQPIVLFRPSSFLAAVANVAMLVSLATANHVRAQETSAPVPSCDSWHAQLSAVEGRVEVRRAGTNEWTKIDRSDFLCKGDAVRAQAFSRAMITLPDESVIRLDEHTTLTLNEPDDDAGSLIEILRGVIHIISRDPRSLRFSTPHLNAGLEGTEFDIRVSEIESQSEVAVLEGEVVVTNPAGEIHVPAGNVAAAKPGSAPVARPIAEPIDLMRWASYFPPVLDEELPAPDQVPQAAELSDPRFFARRAAARLSRGNLAAAEDDLATALRLDPHDSTTLAVQTVTALARHDIPEARRLAVEAASASAGSSPGDIALSYVLQADADLAGALDSAQAAMAREPRNSLAWARRAEAELGLGRYEESLASAMRAIELRPSSGYAHSVLGFVLLSRSDVDEAIEAFAQASALDPGAPVPHLGNALALMQRGDLVAGRRQVELAVALDPADALTRSYMGKTYDAENRTELPSSQLDLAKRFDPQDPTAWLYDGLVKSNRNEPVEALQDLLAAFSRNDNMALFRSRFAMDRDLATRSAGMGRVLRELGFEQLALVRGWAAVEADAADYAAHRLLADVYSAKPRHELARVSELLTSQLLQPANLSPLQPQLAQASSFPVNRMGPSDLAFAGLMPLVTSNGLRFQASAVTAENDTFGEDLVLAGLHDRLSYSFGQFHYSTEGFRENNDFDQRMANAFVQFSPGERSSVQAEVRSNETEHGDLAWYFDPNRYSTLLRGRESVDSVRVGGRRRFTDRDEVLASLNYQDVLVSLSNGDPTITADGDARSADVQFVHEASGWNLRSGILHAQGDYVETQSASITIPGGPTLRQSIERTYELGQSSAYAYANLFLTRGFMLTLGVSADSVEEAFVERDEINPKVGAVWTPTDKLTIRAASFETLQGTSTTSKQNPQPRLEPVQVAGFNQLLFGANADASSTNGVAVDAQISQTLFAGVELTTRDTDSYVLSFDPAGGLVPEPTEATEDDAQAYLYWTPRADLGFSARYQNEHFEADAGSQYAFTHMRIRRLPVEARYFSPSGFSAGLTVSRLEQSGEFVLAPTPDGETTAFGEDDFWIVDASLGYRLPNRRGVLSLNVDNLFDTDFRFQDVDPENPSVMPERVAYFRFTLSFE